MRKLWGTVTSGQTVPSPQQHISSALGHTTAKFPWLSSIRLQHFPGLVLHRAQAAHFPFPQRAIVFLSSCVAVKIHLPFGPKHSNCWVKVQLFTPMRPKWLQFPICLSNEVQFRFNFGATPACCLLELFVSVKKNKSTQFTWNCKWPLV